MRGPSALSFLAGGPYEKVIRKAFLMHVHADKHDEYRDRHNPDWPELEATLKSHGVHNYSIFLDEESSQLFAYVEIEDEARWESIAQHRGVPEMVGSHARSDAVQSRQQPGRQGPAGGVSPRVIA